VGKFATAPLKFTNRRKLNEIKAILAEGAAAALSPDEILYSAVAGADAPARHHAMISHCI
jgi:hypothetical protein